VAVLGWDTQGQQWTVMSQQRYKPFGEVRSDGSITQTDFSYTAHSSLIF